MVKIRLTKKGFRNNVFYRIIAIEDQKKNTGEPLEILGYWHPQKNDKKIKKDRINYWMSQGAKMSETVKKLIS